MKIRTHESEDKILKNVIKSVRSCRGNEDITKRGNFVINRLHIRPYYNKVLLNENTV
jgi:hypothetical protein